MANNFYTLLTSIGQATIANAIALGQKVSLTHMSVGDGNGNSTVPKESQTTLVNEVYRSQVNQLTTDPDNPNYLIAEMIVPTNVGGWAVREVGLFDENENLIAIANFPETYKPKLEEGSGRDLVIRIILQVSNTNAVVLKIDPAIILASQSWVIENFNKKTLFPGGKEQQVLTKFSDNDGDMGWKYFSGVPIGTVEHFAMTTPPPGYLKADGTAVGRETYPDLFAAIGTTFGAGDGSTTFNLPDLINRFAQGSNTPGQKIEAGLPNVTGNFYDVIAQNGGGATDVFRLNETGGAAGFTNSGTAKFSNFNFDPSRSNRIYGASDTVQPPALTLLPCIKAFDAATNPGLINITGLANEIAGKVDRYIDNKPVRYVIDAYNDGTNWWRKWSDGWVEQGGYITNISGGVKVNLPLAMSSHIYFYSAMSREAGDNANIVNYAPTSTNTVLHLNAIMSNGSWSPVTIVWEVKGQGAQS